ncbi:MAG: hypothetical protein QXZ58_08330 [Candidatus Nezhaarchaeales archaeon]
MSEVINEKYFLLFFIKCPLCNKTFVSLSKRQVVQNVNNHMRSHKDFKFHVLPPIEVRLVKVVEEGEG